jgi:hypothetical protein
MGQTARKMAKVRYPLGPTNVYVYKMYREFYWGPFDSVEDARAFYWAEKAEDPYFDYDGILCTRGVEVMPESSLDLPWIRDWK